MEQPNIDLMQPVPAVEPVSPELTQKPTVPVRDRVLAIALLALGYLVCRFTIHGAPLLGLVYGLILYGLSLWHFRSRMGRRALTMLAIGVLFLLAHLFTDNGPVRFFARWLALLLWGYGVYCAGGNAQQERLGDMFVPELFKANVLMPFSRLGAFFTAVFTGGRRSWIKTALLVLAGLGLALLPLSLVVELLQYDDAFHRLLHALLTADLAEAILMRLIYLLLAVAMAALLVSAVQGSRERRLARVLDRGSWTVFRSRCRFLPLVVSAAMLVPLLLVYGLFFLSQWPLYTAAFTGVLPSGYTYADYAREGFFQLCAVCAINGLICLFVSLCTRAEQGEALRRGLLTALCLCSLILAATAFSKMVLYIRTYGLTPLRVYSSWAMVLLTAAFLLALVGAYWRKLDLTRALFVLFAVMFGCLCLVDTDALIAHCNVRAYERGRLDAVDMGVLWELGDAAVPAAARLAKDPKYGEEAQSFLSCHGEKSWLSALGHGVPGLRARAICAPYWLNAAVVRVRIDTEDSFASLGCGYWINEYYYSAGVCSNADGTPFSRGQGTFFELEQPQGERNAMGQGTGVQFRLSVLNGAGRELPTNGLDCLCGDEVDVVLTGSAEKGYAIARAD